MGPCSPEIGAVAKKKVKVVKKKPKKKTTKATTKKVKKKAKKAKAKKHSATKPGAIRLVFDMSGKPSSRTKRVSYDCPCCGEKNSVVVPGHYRLVEVQSDR
jgi:hypothetical protein